MKVIVADGIFYMDGVVSKLKKICDLADKYEALVFVDESHSFGILGEKGRGASELEGVLDRVDIISFTTTKALGGSNSGFIVSN